MGTHPQGGGGGHFLAVALMTQCLAWSFLTGAKAGGEYDFPAIDAIGLELILAGIVGHRVPLIQAFI